MGSLRVLTIVLIFFQTVCAILISWWTLNCMFSPSIFEIQELSLTKLLYLYDPEACGRIMFYNVTMKTSKYTIDIMWPTKNKIARSFRRKLSFWLTLHIFWFLLSIGNVVYGRRSCGFYVAVVPFTLTGLGLLILDCIYTGMFLQDLAYTKSEAEIIKYISSRGDLKWLHGSGWQIYGLENVSDTSWITLTFAYISSRGIVLWIINFWIIKDNYFNGLAVYRILKKEKKGKKAKV